MTPEYKMGDLVYWQVYVNSHSLELTMFWGLLVDVPVYRDIVISCKMLDLGTMEIYFVNLAALLPCAWRPGTANWDIEYFKVDE